MIQIVWRSTHCMAVIKPAGLPTQAPAPHESLETIVREQLAGEAQAAEAPYVALPHRLDRAVSGIVLVALSKRAAGLLGQQFETRKVAKSYLAWVQGQVGGGQMRWIDQLRKLSGEAKSEIVPAELLQREPSEAAPNGAAEPHSQQAVTEVCVLQHCGEESLLELKPLTGRMHQLRVQCAQRGHPILGDTLYHSLHPWPAATHARPADVEKADHQQLGTVAAGRQHIALHAWKISFRDPRSGEAVNLEALPCWPESRMPQPGTTLRSSTLQTGGASFSD